MRDTLVFSRTVKYQRLPTYDVGKGEKKDLKKKQNHFRHSEIKSDRFRAPLMF